MCACISHMHLSKMLAQWLLVGFYSSGRGIFDCGFKGCTWSNTIQWRSPPAVSLQTPTTWSMRIFIACSGASMISTIHCDWSLSVTPCGCIQNKTPNVHGQALLSHNKSKSKKPCEDSHSWSEPRPREPAHVFICMTVWILQGEASCGCNWFTRATH